MMDILGGGAGAAPAGDLIKDVTEETFMAEVVDASMEVPVIVDFWAPWCGPCKSITSVIQNLSSLYPDVTFVEVRRAVHVLC